MEVFIKVLRDPELFSDESRERREIYICLAAGSIADSRINGGAKISFKSCLISWRFFSVHSAEVMYQAKILLFGVNCWL